MTPSPDPITPELRKAEHEIDEAYQSNVLLKEGFATAAWFLLAFVEDVAIKPMLKQEANSIYDVAINADNLVTHLRYPLYWLFKSCPAGGKIPFHYDGDRYKAAWDLFELGEQYQSYVAAFTYATRGMVELELHEKQIIPLQSYLADTRYEAYDRLIKPSSDTSLPTILPILEAVEKSLKVENERFTYKLDPKIARLAQSALHPLFDEMFVLPPDWAFSRYSLQDFRLFYETVASIAAIHWCARYIAALNQCVGIGFADSIWVSDREAFVRRVTRYSGLQESVVQEIMHDVTYGSNNIQFPDPATQPLIPLGQDHFAVMPWLWLSNSAERNLTVLLNKLPAERQYYARLVNEKEAVLRQQMQSMWTHLPFRYYYGPIPGAATVPDIDLAIISDTEKACLLIELKWFIEPADIGEVIEKSEELRKGVIQLEQLSELFTQGFQPLLDVLGINTSYTCCFAVASANSIGHANVQNPDVAIIKAEHLARRIAASEELLPTMQWIHNRAYLPTEGKDYKVMEVVSTINDWSLKWYGIRPLLLDAFSPL